VLKSSKVRLEELVQQVLLFRYTSGIQIVILLSCLMQNDVMLLVSLVTKNLTLP